LYNMLAPGRYDFAKEFKNASVNETNLWIPIFRDRDGNSVTRLDLTVMVSGKMITSHAEVTDSEKIATTKIMEGRAFDGSGGVPTVRDGFFTGSIPGSANLRRLKELLDVDCDPNLFAPCLGLIFCILAMTAWYSLKAFRRRQRVNALVAKFREILMKERTGGFKPLGRDEAAYYV